MSAPCTLLVGLGNPCLGDDGIGVRLAREVALLYEGRAGLDVLPDGPAGALDIVERLAGYARVILVDALDAPGLPPGTVLHQDASALGPAVPASHVHAIELAIALEFGRQAGLPLPAPSDIHVLGVAAAETGSFSEALSPAMEKAYSSVRDTVVAEVAAICGTQPLEIRGA